MMEILSGKTLRPQLASEIEKELKDVSLSFYLYSNPDDFPSQAYLRGIKKMLDTFHVPYREGHIDLNKSKEENLSLFEKESQGSFILLARPLKADCEKEFLERIPFDYDPDMLTERNRGRLFGGDLDYLPATSQSVRYIIENYHLPVQGKKALVVGRSTEVGYPCFQLLNRMNAAVTLTHSKVSKEVLSSYVREADIIILATGHSGLIDRKDLNDRKIIIDCGFNPHGGDLGFVPEDRELLAYTPVPGGVGALTSYCLLRNAIYLKKKN